MNFKKLTNQKGITGIDVVIAITIISITTIAIVALYTNTIVGSKKVTRTSAATRVATSILENVDSMYYAEVEAEIDRLSNIANDSDSTKTKYVTKQEDNSTNNYTQFTIPSSANEVIFNSRVNSGYDVILDIKEIDGVTQSTSKATISDCSLVIEVKVTVKYKVSNITEEVTLKTVKKRELLNECNEPDLNLLLGKEGATTGEQIKSLNQINPIKWSNDTNSYIKTNISDGWYSYSNKEWAKVVITEQNNSEGTFDLSTAKVNNIDSQKVYMWIPRFGKTSEENPQIAFAYKASNDRIKEYEIGANLNASKDTYTRTLTFNGVAYFNEGKVDKETLKITGFNKNSTGIWVDISEGKLRDLTKQAILNDLNSSKYGPTISHISNRYYY